MHTKTLITSAPRSGTLHAAYLLRGTGLDIPHERLGLDGSVSWYGEAHIENGKPRVAKMDQIFHQTRDPRGCISSLWTIADGTKKFVATRLRDAFGININWGKPNAAMQTWLYWNRLVEQRAIWRYRLEDFEQIWPELMERLKRPTSTPPGLKWGYRGPNPHSRKHHPTYRPTTWATMRGIDPALTDEIATMAERYGYETQTTTET